jgi:hypothetical protein
MDEFGGAEADATDPRRAVASRPKRERQTALGSASPLPSLALSQAGERRSRADAAQAAGRVDVGVAATRYEA